MQGPPLLKSIKVLEKIALDMDEVCIMNTVIETAAPSAEPGGGGVSQSWVTSYFSSLGMSAERCNNIISKSAEMLGEYDFFFEWFTKPTMEQLNKLIEKIDEALTPLGCRYMITSK